MCFAEFKTVAYLRHEIGNPDNERNKAMSYSLTITHTVWE